MDPFVRRLVQRLNDPARPLSRNRHFHTFETPEGKQALRVARRLRALQAQILSCQREGGAVALHRSPASPDGGDLRLELHLHRINGRCTAMLDADEVELLVQLPGVSEALPAVRPGRVA